MPVTNLDAAGGRMEWGHRLSFYPQFPIGNRTIGDYNSVVRSQT